MTVFLAALITFANEVSCKELPVDFVSLKYLMTYDCSHVAVTDMIVIGSHSLEYM